MSDLEAKLRKLADYYGGKGEHPEWAGGYSPDIVATLTEAASVISDGRWVPITERLPDESEWGGVIHAVLATDGKKVFVETTHPSWWNHKASLRENNGPTVTHWMPLPEAPK